MESLTVAERAQCKRLYMAGYRHTDYVRGAEALTGDYLPVVYELLSLEVSDYVARHGVEAPLCGCGFCEAMRGRLDLLLQ